MELRVDIHPSTDTLQAFSLGKLDDGSAATLANHLANCLACQQAAAAMSSDQFLDRLRAAHDRSGTPAPASNYPPYPRACQVPGRPRRRRERRQPCRQNWSITRSTKSSANWAAAAWASSTWHATSCWTAWKCSRWSTRPCWSGPASPSASCGRSNPPPG